MRVLMFCPQFAPLIGGAELQAERLGRALVARGIDVLVLTPRLDATSPDEEVRDGLNVRRFQLRDLTRAMPGWRGVGLLNAPWIVLQLIVRLWKEVGRADIVHCHIGSLQTIAVAITAHLRGRPVICKAAVADERSDLGEMSRGGLMSSLFAHLGRGIFTRWVATTREVSAALQRAGVSLEDIVVIPNGVELQPDRGFRYRPVRRFLYLGRLARNTDRDVPGLIRAFDALAAQVPDIQLAIVGGGDLLVETRRLASGCVHAHLIQVPGPGPAQQWLAWADCFVLPSRREGLPNALLEAMASGLPCVANDIAPNREVLADGAAGLLVAVGVDDAMRASMAQLTIRHELAESLSRAASRRVSRHYGLDAVAIAYAKLYQSLLKRGAPVNH